MNLENYYWYFQKAVPEHICDELVKYGLQSKEQMGVTRGFSNPPTSEEQIKDLKKKRDSDIVWLDGNWIYKEIHPFIHSANAKAGWNFEWDFSEVCQFTKYEKGQFYNWHTDSWKDRIIKPNDPNLHGKIRKLSATLSLSDEKNYKGGELEFDFRNLDPGKDSTKICTEIGPKGSMVIFPSFVWHRVKPVTQGLRYSLVIWNLGKPLK